MKLLSPPPPRPPARSRKGTAKTRRPVLARLDDRQRAMVRAAVLALLLATGTLPARADTVTVTASPTRDEKAVFATVESAYVVPARARIGGTVAKIDVKYGDHVERGQAIAAVGDTKLILQMGSLDAQIAGLEAQVAQAKIDLDRTESLFERGTVARSRLDEVRTAFNVADNALRARRAEKSVIEQQLAEGTVFAPTSGRVLKVPVTPGTVTLPGEAIALIAEGNFVLRLRVPERHARFLKPGDTVRIDGEPLGRSDALFGTIKLIYPQIEDGRVVADAAVDGLGDYFVGERIRVWVSAGERDAMVVPARFVRTRFGIDYVGLARDGDPAGAVIEVPVQRGRLVRRPGEPDAVEILSGLKSGDRLVAP